jgi:hypothetical protein
LRISQPLLTSQDSHSQLLYTPKSMKVNALHRMKSVRAISKFGTTLRPINSMIRPQTGIAKARKKTLGQNDK